MTELVCIGCPRGCRLQVDEANDYAVSGNRCPIGAEYGRNELKNPTRVLTSTVVLEGGLHKRLPVKTSAPIAKGRLFEVMAAINTLRIQAPVAVGQVLVPNICGTGADLISCKNAVKKDA